MESQQLPVTVPAFNVDSFLLAKRHLLLQQHQNETAAYTDGSNPDYNGSSSYVIIKKQ